MLAAVSQPSDPFPRQFFQVLINSPFRCLRKRPENGVHAFMCDMKLIVM